MTPRKQTLWLTFLSFAPSAGDSKGIEDMDMNVVRLCFQCELEWDDGRKDCLSPVVSNPIYDKSKSSPDTHLWLLTTVWTSAFKNVFLGSNPLLHVFLFSQRPLLHHSSRSAVWTSTEVPVTARRKFTCFVTKCRKVCFICGYSDSDFADVQNIQTVNTQYDDDDVTLFMLPTFISCD